jgi:hypothetical protein
MNDDIVYRIFVELAVLEGKRDPAGNWKTSEPKDVGRLLRRAFTLVTRASSPGPDDSE